MSAVKFFKLLIGAALVLFLMPCEAKAGKFIFSDVEEGHVNFIAINWLKQNNIVNGYIDGSFDPDKKVNRAEALKMIFKCLNVSVDQVQAEQPFPDVPNESWFANYVKKAKELGVVNGYQDGYFRPENNMNKAEALKVIFEILGTKLKTSEEDPFADVPKDSWFSSYAQIAKEKTILDINLDNNVHLEEYLTRGGIAEMIYRAKMSNQGIKFGKITFYSDSFNGNGTAFGETFDNNAMTAAHLTLPYNTIVKVTNLENGKTVEVRINDRGPFTEGRVLDLSKAAFEQIAYLGSGYVHGQYEIIESK